MTRSEELRDQLRWFIETGAADELTQGQLREGFNRLLPAVHDALLSPPERPEPAFCKVCGYKHCETVGGREPCPGYNPNLATERPEEGP